MLCYDMDHAYDLRVAGVHLRILAPCELQFPACFEPFLLGEAEITEYDRPDWRIEIYFGKGELSLAEGDLVTRFPRSSGDDFIRVVPADRARTCRFFVPEEIADTFPAHANWALFLIPEQLLLPYDRVFLHASAIIDEGEAILFTAPSGGGKSTQAALWESVFGAEILNGDKAIIATGETPLAVYGGPIAGSSEIYKNKKAPIKAIVYVQKGSRNEVIRLDDRRAFMVLYSHMVKSHDDAAFNRKLLPQIAKIVASVPILELTCLPEPSAAETLRAWLKTHLPSSS